MKKDNKNALIALPIVIVIAILIGLAGSQGGSNIGGMPLFLLLIGLAFLIQWISFIFAYTKQTEMYFDLTGSLTYIFIVILAVVLSPKVDFRGYLIMSMVIVWAARLGSFLYKRIKKAGEDSRFTDIKPSFVRFLNVWNIQGLWVSLTLAAALTVITTMNKIEFSVVGWVGLIVWLIGITIEAISDQQKTNFRNKPENKGKFIYQGLWSWSRHPNYFGEILLWIGIAIIAIPVLQGWQWLMLISPLFVFLLITRVSGVPQLESRADEKWGGQDDYETYKKNTSVLIPMPPKK